MQSIDIAVSGKTLSDILEEFKRYLRTSHQNASWECLYDAYRQFSLLANPAEEWRSYIDSHRIYCWHEDPKSAVGAHLFYPEELVFLYAPMDFFTFSFDSTMHLARNDFLWAFGIAASFGHPLGYYYISYYIRKKCDYVSDYLTLLARTAHEKCFKILESKKDNPDSLFILGLREVDDHHSNISGACDYLERGWEEFKDKRCKTMSIKIRAIFSNEFEGSNRAMCSEEQQLKELLEVDYGLADILAASLCEGKDTKRAIEIAEKAYDRGPPFDSFACIKLGMNYDKIDPRTAFDWYYYAGELGLSTGYIFAAKRCVGGDFEIRTNFKKYGWHFDDFQSAAKILKTASEKSDPRALSVAYQLGSSLRVVYETKEFDKDVEDALAKAASLGFGWAHHILNVSLNRGKNFVADHYGEPSSGLMFKRMIQNLMLDLPTKE